MDNSINISTAVRDIEDQVSKTKLKIQVLHEGFQGLADHDAVVISDSVGFFLGLEIISAELVKELGSVQDRCFAIERCLKDKAPGATQDMDPGA